MKELAVLGIGFVVLGLPFLYFYNEGKRNKGHTCFPIRTNHVQFAANRKELARTVANCNPLRERVDWGSGSCSSYRKNWSAVRN
jgi:hypothetical protein